MTLDPDFLIRLKDQLRMLQDMGFKYVIPQQLVESLGISDQNLLDCLSVLGIPIGDQGIELSSIPLHQSIQRDAFTQVGNQNQQYNVKGTLVQLTEGGAGQLHQLFPQPGEEARIVLRREMANLVSYLQALPRIDNSTDQTAEGWYIAVETHCKPLVQSLFAAIKLMPQDVVASEITGLIEESIRVLGLQIPGIQVDHSIAWKTYPLLIIATSVVLAVLATNRWSILQPLVAPTIQIQSQSKIHWLYLTHYIDEFLPRFRFPNRERLRYPSLAVEQRITQLLVGDNGWLLNELPVFGNEKRVRQAHAILALLILDAEMRYFTGPEHDSQRRLRIGNFYWHKEEAREAIAEMVRGVKVLPSGNKILTGNADLSYTNFVDIISRNTASIF